MKSEDKALNKDRLMCKEKEGEEVNELFLNQYNVIKFSHLWKWEICIYAQWNIDEQRLWLLHLSQRKKGRAHYLLVTFLQNWLTLIHFCLHWSYGVYWIWPVLIIIAHILIQVILFSNSCIFDYFFNCLTNMNNTVSSPGYIQAWIGIPWEENFKKIKGKYENNDVVVSSSLG